MPRSLFTLMMLVCGLGLSMADATPAAAQKKKATSKKKAAPKPPATRLPTLPRSTVEIKPVNERFRDTAIRSAERIDALVEAALKKAGQTPHELSLNHQFVRRIYLDANGTIPTARQTTLYTRSRSTSRRHTLVDTLLSRPGYASQMYNWMADFLRVVDKADNNTYLRPWGDWVKQNLRDNTPWDKMVHEMLTAEGKSWENPAVGFVLRDPGMPLDNLNNAVRVFMGTRIGCAQCHDHPFDRWTQKEFYQLAAFTAGTQYRLYGKAGPSVDNKTLDSAAGGGNSPEARKGRSILRMNRPGVFDNARKQLKFPSDYGYEDAKPGELVKTAFLFQKSPVTVTPTDRRKKFADWVTSYDNDRFAMTMANRLWKKAMGVGIVEPVDDHMDESTSSNPALLDFLASELKRLRFDLKEFQRIIYYSNTYQRRVTYKDLDPEKPYLFPGPILRRMTAEQVWDSLLTLTLTNPDAALRPGDDEYTSIIDVDNNTSAQQILQKAKQLIAYEKADRARKNKRLYKGQELLRASELPQPLPEAHFIRQFGQSERDIINDSHTDGTVPQLLTMFNGAVTHMMLEKGSVIYNEVLKEDDIDDQVTVIFQSMLNRVPNTREAAAAKGEMRNAKAAGYGNVIWALLNTREFLFIQ